MGLSVEAPPRLQPIPPGVKAGRRRSRKNRLTERLVVQERAALYNPRTMYLTRSVKADLPDLQAAPSRRRALPSLFPYPADGSFEGRLTTWSVLALLLIKLALAVLVATGDTAAIYRFVT